MTSRKPIARTWGAVSWEEREKVGGRKEGDEGLQVERRGDERRRGR